MTATLQRFPCPLAMAAGLLFAVMPLSPGRCEPQADIRQLQPEAATGRQSKPATLAQHHMIIAANPYAVAAGLDVLRAGGSAVDAAIAAQMVLALVEPQSSGLGGGAFLVHWDAKNEAIETVDGRETAPLAARPDRFLRPDGATRTFDDVVGTPASVGVPGVLRALEQAHQRHGRLPWARLFDPAIALADQGFVVSPRLSSLLAVQGPAFFNAEARALYFDGAGAARATGSVLKNPTLAATLRLIATLGADAFYNGPLASAIVWALQSVPSAVPGAVSDMTIEDFAGYAAKQRDPVCAPYRGYRICSMGPPSSGAITMGMALGMVQAVTPQQVDQGVKTGEQAALVLREGLAEIAVLAEAEKLAFADRDQFIADPDFVPQSANLLDPAYLAARAKLIDPAHPIAKAQPGSPPIKTGSLLGIDATVEQSGTSHLSILDDAGNAVSMTTTVQSAFGSGIMVGGFLLNSQLTDFSFKPADASGVPIANRVEGGKRPRSSMAPTLIFDPKGQLFAILGSPGGSGIILYNLKAIVCLIDWHCNTELAASLPNFGSRNGPFEVESGTLAQSDLAGAMAANGSSVSTVDMTSGLAIIERRDGIVEGAADPRREGIAQGD